jgi:hypothetical protein
MSFKLRWLRSEWARASNPVEIGRTAGQGCTKCWGALYVPALYVRTNAGKNNFVVFSHILPHNDKVAIEDRCGHKTPQFCQPCIEACVLRLPLPSATTGVLMSSEQMGCCFPWAIFEAHLSSCRSLVRHPTKKETLYHYILVILLCGGERPKQDWKFFHSLKAATFLQFLTCNSCEYYFHMAQKYF